MHIIKIGRKGLKKYKKLKVKSDSPNQFRDKMIDHPLALTDCRYKGAKVIVQKI